MSRMNCDMFYFHSSGGRYKCVGNFQFYYKKYIEKRSDWFRIGLLCIYIEYILVKVYINILK